MPSIGSFFSNLGVLKKVTSEVKTEQEKNSSSQISDANLKKASQSQANYGMALLQKGGVSKKLDLIEENIHKLNDEEKKQKADKAGFTQQVIDELKQKSEFYGPELVDEAVDMAIFLDSAFDEGIPITKKLVESAISKFSPEASGGSAYGQRGILANTWVHGDEIYKAYGQKPPIRTKAVLDLTPEEKQTKLDKAGFSKDVIDELKAKSGFYGPELVDEALNMAIYLDSELEKGTKITKQLLDDVIDAFSPGASGGSSYTQMGMLAETWTHGDLIRKAYK